MTTEVTKPVEIVDPSATEPTPEPLSEDQLGSLLSAFGNNESKALTLVAMEPGVIYQSGNLKRELHSRQTERGWDINSKTLIMYCSESLSPIGLVARELIDPDTGSYGFILTELGEEIGKPLAGHLLDFSLKHPQISLFELFGATFSNASSGRSIDDEGQENFPRAPQKALLLFEALLTSQLPLRVTDLAYEMGVDISEIDTVLERLGARGVVQHRSEIGRAESVMYSVSPGAKDIDITAPPRNSDITLGQRIYDTLLVHFNGQGEVAPVSISDVQELVKTAYPQYIERKNLNVAVTRILRHFNREGILTSETPWDYTKRSSVDLTPEQRELLEELVIICHRFQGQAEDFIAEGRQKYRRIVRNPKEKTILLEKAREASPFANRRTITERAGFVRAALSAGEELRTTEIHNRTSALGLQVGKMSVFKTLKSMVESGEVEERVKSGVAHWKLKFQIEES